MIELIIDTCSDRLNVVLIRGGKVLSSAYCSEIKRHSVALLGKVKQALFEGDCKLADVDCFGVVVGSGSFTGIRVGLATVKAFCYALEKKAKAITSCESVAYNRSIRGKKLGIIDAKQNMLYVQAFEDGTAAGDIVCVDRSQLNDYLKKYQAFEVFSQTELADVSYTLVTDNTEGLKNAMSLKEPTGCAEIQPVYVRKPQAESDLESAGGISS